MTLALENRIKTLEKQVAFLEDALENNWARDAIEQHDPNEEVFPAALLNALLADENPIKVYRKYRGFSQSVLAELSGTSTAYISQIETGHRKVGTTLLEAISKALSVDMEQIV